MAQVQILAFAGVRDVIGADSVGIDVEDGLSPDELLSALCERYPALAAYRGSIRVAINGCYTQGSERVVSGDEVALIPPVAGD